MSMSQVSLGCTHSTTGAQVRRPPVGRGLNPKKRLLGQYNETSVLAQEAAGSDMNILMRMEMLKQEYQKTQSELIRLEQTRARKASRSPR